ncbi:MAG: hypothetical protein U0176_02305 [Bacteroidia bacterium]
MKIYESLYDQGKFSEQMLYRLAFMHENLRSYPQAIFYLKKAAQEYGEKGTDGKIRQLMQRQGSTRFFSGDGWNDYMLFFRNWNWAFLLAFFLAMAGIAAHYLIPLKQLRGWRQLAVIGAWVIFFVAGAALFHRSFLVPDRAVLMQDTAFYSEPGFSSNYRLGSFSLGETLEITSRSDIWVQISAAGRQWWVPNWVVREL